MLPTFLIIGAAKSGTTSLSYYLSLHPEVFMYRDREPHFFATNLESGIPIAADSVRTIEDYMHLFPEGLAVRGESSPGYSQYPARPGVPARIRGVIPDVRLIYVVRDPIDRLVSHYLHQVAMEGETRSFEEALGNLEDPTRIYVCAGRYAMQLRQYLEHFAKDQILVVDQVRLAVDRPGILSEIFEFLGVDSSFTSEEFTRHIGSASEPLRWLPGGDRLFYGQRGQRLRARMPMRRQIRRGLEVVARRFVSPPDRPEIDPALRKRLVGLFQEDVEDLRTLTKQTFAGWSM